MPVSIAFCSKGCGRIVGVVVTKLVDVIGKEKFIPKINNSAKELSHLLVFIRGNSLRIDFNC